LRSAYLAALVVLPFALHAHAGEPDRSRWHGTLSGRNVVLVSIDTLRADHLGAYGYPRPTSPGIDALGRESMLFERCYSQSPLTAPSHMTLLTGVLPPVHGVCNWGKAGGEARLSDALPTLATILSRAGYRTAAHVAGGNVHEAFGFDQGFDAWTSVEWGDLDSAGLMMASLAGQKPRKPFFFFVHTYQVHSPYVPGREYAKLFADPAYAGRIPVSREELAALAGSDAWLKAAGHFWGRVDLKNPADMRQLVDLYDAGIRRMDDDLALFLRRFRDAGLDGNTLLILASDHGEEFMDHGGLQHGGHLYDEALHVPLLVHLPEGASARRVSGVARLMDVLPTVLDLLGMATPSHVQGESLLPLLTASARSRPVYANEPGGGIQSLRVGTMKYIHHTNAEELYDLERDPGERLNLLDTTDSTERYAWRQRADRVLEACLSLGARFRPGPRPELDPETRRQLQALGYIGGLD
jgi:arylsulfatase A-like enzyme